MKLASDICRASLLLSMLLLDSTITALQVQPTSTPPLTDVPTYSLATIDEDGHTNMNIVTYASPASIQPDRLWSIGILKSSLSHTNFLRSKNGILQLLRPQHANLVRLLGGSSGLHVDKASACFECGLEWQSIEATLPLVLPDCAHYLLLSCIQVIDGGSHDIFICKVERMWETADGQPSSKDEDDSYLSTRRLRQLGIITEQGRVAED